MGRYAAADAAQAQQQGAKELAAGYQNEAAGLAKTIQAVLVQCVGLCQYAERCPEEVDGKAIRKLEADAMRVAAELVALNECAATEITRRREISPTTEKGDPTAGEDASPTNTTPRWNIPQDDIPSISSA